MNYENYSDEQLVLLASGNSDDADNALEEIFGRYKFKINKIVRSYYLINGDEGDLYQEGMIGLFKAIKSYNGNGLFAPYAHVCIKNSVFSAIKKSNRKKNIPLNDYISLSGGDDDDVDKNYFISDVNNNPEKTCIEKEEEEELANRLKILLSPLESKVLNYYLNGFSYEDIANKTNKNIKSIDNAIQRIRTKLSAVK